LGKGWNEERLDIANILPHATLPVTGNVKTEDVNAASKALWIFPLISDGLIPLANAAKLGHKNSIFLSFLFYASLPPTSPSSLQDGAQMLLKNSETALHL